MKGFYTHSKSDNINWIKPRGREKIYLCNIKKGKRKKGGRNTAKGGKKKGENEI